MADKHYHYSYRSFDVIRKTYGDRYPKPPIEANFTNLPKIVRKCITQRPRIGMIEPLQMESEIARLDAWWRGVFYSIHVMGNLPKIVSECTPPPPHPRVQLYGTIFWQNHTS